jgi:hypothetical protein
MESTFARMINFLFVDLVFANVRYSFLGKRLDNTVFYEPEYFYRYSQRFGISER